MLQPSIKQQCLNDVKLFCIVAEAAAKKPGATLMMLHRNTAKDLATVTVVNAISAYTGLAHEQILLTEKVEAQ